MLATVDFLTVSGWAIGIISLVLAVIESIRSLFARKDGRALRSHLRSIGEHLNAMQTSIKQTQDAAVSQEEGKRFLGGLSLDVYALQKQVQEALADKEPRVSKAS